MLSKVWERSRANGLNPQVLAFIGDAVHSLVMRCELADGHDNRSGRLHELAVGEISAVAQARHAERVLPLLTEEETAIYRRGRNTKVNSFSKNVPRADYMKATGFEAVLGYLYLIGEYERLLELIHS